MEIFSRSVDRLDPSQRQATEAVIGRPLQSNGRLVIQILDSDAAAEFGGNGAGSSRLPDWCNVLTDLTPEESAALDGSLAARTESRSNPTSRT
jgi:hypothetical protein